MAIPGRAPMLSADYSIGIASGCFHGPKLQAHSMCRPPPYSCVFGNRLTLIHGPSLPLVMQIDRALAVVQHDRNQ